jgi:two-component system cell cycle sensor histidine kinase/response regulator CckA
MAKILKTHQPVISDVFTAVQNYSAVAYHVPVMKNGKFHGTLAVLIPFDQIAGEYLENIRKEGVHSTWLLSAHGVELYCSNRDHIGTEAHLQQKPDPELLNVLDRMANANEGHSVYYGQSDDNMDHAELPMHLVYQPIHLGNTHWSLLLGTPESEMMQTMTGFSYRWALIIIILVIVGALYTYYFLKVSVILKEEKRRQEAESALRDSEKRFRDLVDLLPQTVFEISLDGVLTFANNNAFSLFGYTRQEFAAGLNVTSMLAERSRDQALKNIENVISGKTNDQTEYIACTKSGREFPVLIYSTLVLRDDQPAGIRGILIDVTDLKIAEQALRDSEQQFRSYIDNAPDGVVVFDSAGTILDSNLAFLQITGLEKIVPGSKRLGELIEENDQEKLHSYIKSLVFRGKANADFNFRREDDKCGQWAISAVVLSPQKMLGFVRDITESKLLEEQFRQAQKMEAVGQLAGGVAHDFNNLLTVISGYSSMLLMQKTDDPEATDKLEQILRASERAEALTRQLLAFSRKQIAQPVILDLNSVIIDSLKMLTRLIGEDIGIDLKLKEKSMPIMADPHQLEQILVNLFVNARDAIIAREDNPAEKVIRVETREVYFNSDYVKTHLGSHEGPRVLIAISDTGTGMDRETREKIFDPFFTTKEQGKGTGLGLSTVYGIVKQNKANIYVYSEPGQGTTFNIYWPLEALKQPDDLESKSESKLIPGKERILLAEDDEAVREFATESLRRMGYTVFSAADGEEALDILNRDIEPPDLLLTDVVMPGIDGHQLAQKVTEKYPKIKVIYSSGYTDSHIMQKGFVDQNVFFLQKPYSMSVLSHTIRDVLDQ